MSKKETNKTKYHSLVQPRLKEIEEFSYNQITERDMAKLLGISYSSLCRYKRENEELREAIASGRASLISSVRKSVRNMAIGYNYIDEVVMKVKDSGFDENGKKWETERLEKIEVSRYSKPELAAAIVLLKNYDRMNITGHSFTNRDEVDEKFKEREVKIKEEANDDGF